MKPSQNGRILDYMREHGKITQRDAYPLGCMRLGARIYDLRKIGYNIMTINKKVMNRDGSTTYIAEYRLIEPKGEEHATLI